MSFLDTLVYRPEQGIFGGMRLPTFDPVVVDGYTVREQLSWELEFTMEFVQFTIENEILLARPRNDVFF